ncbi:MAG: hypothetical protein JWM93_1967, partial [Frankiales bacterium]|nr:hypothetical protein [Frankiales bacterium]
HPFRDRLLGMLREPLQRTCETEPLDASATEDAVGFCDPLHCDQLP